MANLDKSPWPILTFIAMASFTIYLTFINMANLPKSPWQYLTFIAMANFTIYLSWKIYLY